ncbi:MAG: hypothetical protein IT330_11660 [Anaerolineae bacterium]|nr:hypothetical protein [Anaerolineae bacterium]
MNLLESPLGPALVLVFGALALLLFPRRTSTWLSRSAAVVIALAALGRLIVLRASVVGPGIGWAWQPPVVAAGEIAWVGDSWAWLVGILLLIEALVALLLEEAEGRRPRSVYVATLLLAAASLLFILSANLLTLTIAWVLMDLALALRVGPVARPGVAVRAWGVNSLGAWLLLAALLAAGPAAARFAPLAGPLPTLSRTIVVLLALLRLGAYPLHLWRDPRAAQELGPAVALFLLAPTAGLWLLGRAAALGQPGWLLTRQWAALGVFALMGSALAAWTEADDARSIGWVLINRASLGLLAVVLYPAGGTAAVTWPLISLALGGAALLIGLASDARWGWHLPALAAIVALFGLPFTSGFPLRSSLARLGLAPPSGNVVLWAGLLLADSLLVAALLRSWQAVRAGSNPRPATVARVLLAALLVVPPLLVAGLRPPLVAHLIGLDPMIFGFAPASQLLQVRWSAVRWGLIIPLAFGILLAWGRTRIFAGLRGWQMAVTAVVSLEWVYRSGRRAAAIIASALRGAVAMVEGEGYLGWLVLAGLVIWVLSLRQ